MVLIYDSNHYIKYNLKILKLFYDILLLLVSPANINLEPPCLFNLSIWTLIRRLGFKLLFILTKSTKVLRIIALKLIFLSRFLLFTTQMSGKEIIILTFFLRYMVNLIIFFIIIFIIRNILLHLLLLIIISNYRNIILLLLFQLLISGNIILILIFFNWLI